MVTPKTNVQTFAAERDDLARRHYASQDLFARENTADKAASKLADEFTKAFSDALAKRGYRPIVGAELENDIMFHDGEVLESSDDWQLSRDMQHLKPSPLPTTHFDQADGYVSQHGAYPLRHAYLETGTYPELTIAPVDLVRGAHHTTLLKRQLVRASNRYSQRHAVLGEKLPILRDDYDDRQLDGRWSAEDEERYRIIENDDDALTSLEKREIRAAGPLSAFGQRLAKVIYGMQTQFGCDANPSRMSEHITFSLHAPHDKNALFNPDHPESVSLDMHENNLFADRHIAKAVRDIITNHSADDYALLYAGNDSMKRLRHFTLQRDMTDPLDDSLVPSPDMEKCSVYKQADTHVADNVALDEKQCARIEYSLPGAAGNSHLAMLQVASFMYMGARAFDDIYGENEKYYGLPLSAAKDVEAYVSKLHSGSPSIDPTRPDFVNDMIDRFKSGGLLEASVHCLADDIRKDDPERADDLEAKYGEFKQAVIDRARTISREKMGLLREDLGPLR
ncbi:MAG: hypothetical protein MRY32_09540 [Rickettsiales bacterium]|nr:hypothetical protein [Rickettsiales bacterium]